MESKSCPRCQTVRPIGDFARRGDGVQPFCRPCNRDDQREPDRANSATYKRRARTYAEANKEGVRRWAWAYLEASGCCDCGSGDPRVLDFDHRERTAKQFHASHALNGSYTLARVQAEVEKCDVRCANCHRLRTAEQLGWYA